jgi:TonB family protein
MARVVLAILALTLATFAHAASPSSDPRQPATDPTRIDPAWEKAGIKAPPGAAPKPAPIPPAHTAAMLADYPAAARAAGVEGKAAIECSQMLHGAPDQCAVIEEKPYGQGFGQAALALAKRAPQNPALPILPEKKQKWRIDFDFKLKPAPAITPDVLGALHVPPRWDKTAESDDILYAYPTAAKDSRTDGFAVLFCTVAPNGHMKDCIAKATPTRSSFEAAALKLAPKFVLQTKTDDGSTTAGATITIPILFVLP